MKRKPIEEKFQFYPTAEECADAAAPIFQAKRWRWKPIGGIPTREQILDTLLYLQRTQKREGGRYHSTGRLMFDSGRFGYERADR